MMSFTKEDTNGNVLYKIPDPNAKFSFFSTKYISLSLCSICGNYRHSKKSVTKRIFCTCLDDHGNDIYTIMCQFKHRQNFSKVLDQLIFSIYENVEDDKPSHGLSDISRYWHENECNPCPRTCHSCWRYWCGSCHSGLAGMYGGCIYKKCRVGRRNCGLSN
jgi:hypothetical protein